MYDHWEKDPRVAMQLTPRLTTQNVEASAEKQEPEFATEQQNSPFSKNQEDELIASTSNKSSETKVTNLSDADKMRFIRSKKAEGAE